MQHQNIKLNSKFLILLLTFLIPYSSLLIFTSCNRVHAQMTPTNGQSSGTTNPFKSFREVPGITLGEIAAIEALQRERASFSFGNTLSPENFIMENGELGGFTVLFCEWLTELIGIPFKSEAGLFNDLFSRLNGGTLDFVGNLTRTEERLRQYSMTSAISERQLKVMRLRGSPSPEQIANERLPRYALVRNSNNTAMAIEAMRPGSYESVMVNNINEAYQELKAGRADAYIEASTTVDYFSATDVYSELFFPMIFIPVSMAAANPELSPVISVVEKAMRNGAIHYVNYLGNLGFEEYKRERFISQLSDDEKAYLRNPPSPVPMVSRYYNYPVGFYNTYERQWEGIAFDVLAEVSKLTGLRFQVVNKENDEIGSLVEMMENETAYLMPDIPYSESLVGRAIWTQNNFISNQYALLSKTEFPNISLNEISNARIGLIAITIPADMFIAWFPGASNTKVYPTDVSAFSALDRGEIDLLMATKNRLLSIVNYYELPNYKANYLFNNYESSFVFNKDQELLRSIIDKALPLIDTTTIVEQWMTKTYDYRTKVAEERLPLFIGAIILAVGIIALILIMFLRGLGARKFLVQRVAEETATLTAILDTTPDHLFCKDLNLRFTRCNKSMADYHGINRADIIGKGGKDGLKLSISKEIDDQLTALEQKVFTDKQVSISEEPMAAADGRIQIFETIRAPLIMDGEVTGLVGMARDITLRKAAEEEAKKASTEVMKAYAEAETASEAKSRFIANMNHEMRTPMNVIVGLTDLMLEEDSVSAKDKETLKKINTAGTTLMGLINDVLDISKIEAGKQDLKPVQYDMASLLNDIITLNMVRLGEKPIEFKLEIDDNVPKSFYGDDIRIKQILNNLLSNAFKYTKAGTVTLGVGSQKDDRGGIVSFYVRDTGIGIREGDIAKLFTDYNQVDTRANREIEGTGLGLSITKKFVEMMDGEIKVESEFGKGTTFSVRIRQGFVTDVPIAKETVESLRGFHYQDKKKNAQGKMKRADLSYARVLVVDDFPTNLDVAAGMLRKYKMQVDCVLSGQESVDAITAGEPVYNAIFMDHMMPGMDGIEAVKLIRALGTEYAKKLHIVALTANAVSGSEQMFLENGFDAFLAKPFNVMNLDSIVQKWVRDRSRE